MYTVCVCACVCVCVCDLESQILGNLPPISNKLGASSPSLSLSRRSVANSGHSEMQEAYQPPRSTCHLKGNTSRYGCSSNYVKAACGVVPTLHPIINAPNYQTWYANEFGVGVGTGSSHPRPPTPIYPLHLPPILQENRDQVTCQSAKTRTEESGCGKSLRSPRGPGGFSWLSEWAGPM